MICCLAAAWLFGSLVLGLRAIRDFLARGSTAFRRSRALWLTMVGIGMVVAGGAAALTARPVQPAAPAHSVEWILAHLPICGEHGR